MARTLASKTNVTPPGGNYPYGRAKDNTGSGNGTPVDENLLGDLIQYFERLMALGGVTANGLPENSSDGFQYLTALINLISSYVSTEATTRAAADTTLQNNINSEATTRASDDTTLQNNINSEASTRAAADTTLTNTKVAKAGDSMTGNLAMGGNKVTGLAAGTSNGEAIRFEQLPVVTRIATITKVAVVGGATPTISSTDLPNCKIGFWATVAFTATGTDVPGLDYGLSDDSYATNIIRESDPGNFGSANVAEISIFCPLPAGLTGQFSAFLYSGTTGTATIKINMYL